MSEYVWNERFVVSDRVRLTNYATVASAWLCIYNTYDNTVEDLIEYYEDAVRYGIVFC